MRSLRLRLQRCSQRGRLRPLNMLLAQKLLATLAIISPTSGLKAILGYTGKILKGAKRGRQRTGGRRNPPPRTEGAQRCGRLFEMKNRPRANPVRGVGGGPGSRNLVVMAM